MFVVLVGILRLIIELLFANWAILKCFLLSFVLLLHHGLRIELGEALDDLADLTLQFTLHLCSLLESFLLAHYVSCINLHWLWHLCLILSTGKSSTLRISRQLGREDVHRLEVQDRVNQLNGYTLHFPACLDKVGADVVENSVAIASYFFALHHAQLVYGVVRERG